jgi:hypothetical protein
VDGGYMLAQKQFGAEIRICNVGIVRPCLRIWHFVIATTVSSEALVRSINSDVQPPLPEVQVLRCRV